MNARLKRNFKYSAIILTCLAICTSVALSVLLTGSHDNTSNFKSASNQVNNTEPIIQDEVKSQPKPVFSTDASYEGEPLLVHEDNQEVVEPNGFTKQVHYENPVGQVVYEGPTSVEPVYERVERIVSDFGGLLIEDNVQHSLADGYAREDRYLPEIGGQWITDDMSPHAVIDTPPPVVMTYGKYPDPLWIPPNDPNKIMEWAPTPHWIDSLTHIPQPSPIIEPPITPFSMTDAQLDLTPHRRLREVPWEQYEPDFTVMYLRPSWGSAQVLTPDWHIFGAPHEFGYKHTYLDEVTAYYFGQTTVGNTEAFERRDDFNFLYMPVLESQTRLLYRVPQNPLVTVILPIKFKTRNYVQDLHGYTCDNPTINYLWQNPDGTLVDNEGNPTHLNGFTGEFSSEYQAQNYWTSVVSIPSFEGNPGLTGVDLNEAKIISENAFKDSPLTNIFAPQVETIGDKAFWNTVNSYETQVKLPEKFNNPEDLNRIFGTGEGMGSGNGWDQITFFWV